MFASAAIRFVRAGPFTARLETNVDEVLAGVDLLYPPSFLRDGVSFTDFKIAVRRGDGLRRWFRPQTVFETDGERPFKPLPLAQALPMFEWGLNYCIASSAHTYLIIHAAAVERGGRVAILPGGPGAGKSTLVAALAFRGWRLMSDELALLRMTDGAVIALARPISLKNESIDIVKRFEPTAVLSAAVRDTVKGAVALLRAPDASIDRVDEPGMPGWIVFPRWQAGAEARLEPRSKAASLIEIALHAFNYHVHEERGFDLLADVVDRCGCYDFTYSRLEDALDAFAALVPPEETRRAGN